MAKSFYTLNNGAEFLSPGGQSEHGQEYYNAGFRYSMLNIADGHGWDDWSETIKQHQSAGCRIVIGGRVENYGDPLLGVETILLEGIKRHVATFLNIEDEFKTTPPAKFEAKIREIRAAHPTYTRETIINSVGWLYNFSPAYWAPITHRPMQLQVYVIDMGHAPDELPKLTSDCIYHAKIQCGFRDVGVMFETYNGAKPSWYDFWKGMPRAYYSGDQIGGQSAWDQWKVN